jgi:hypothetical protein
METDEFWARVEALRQEVARRRFAGESPELHLRRGESLVEAVARVIAAERSRVPLRVDSVELWLTEDLAREYFYRAQTALQFWNFYLAHRYLDEAAALSRDDLLHQRVSLFRLLTNFVRAVVTTDPAGPARVDPNRVLEGVDRLDKLPAGERDFYKAEVRRLAGLVERRDEDPKLAAAWHFLRARSAFVREEAAGAIIPLLRAYRTLDGSLKPSEFLLRQVELAQELIRFWVGDGPRPAEDIVPESLAYKLHDALDAQAERDLGVRLSALSGQFGLTLYMEGNASG